MTLINWARRHRRTRRRSRSTGLAGASIERRLAPSTILPLPAPHVPSEVAHFERPDPCAEPAGSFIPPDTCAKPATTFTPPDPCDTPPDPCSWLGAEFEGTF
jgi:hypothetical protein